MEIETIYGGNQEWLLERITLTLQPAESSTGLRLLLCNVNPGLGAIYPGDPFGEVVLGLSRLQRLFCF